MSHAKGEGCAPLQGALPVRIVPCGGVSRLAGANQDAGCRVAAQQRTAQHITAHHITAQHSIAQHSTAAHSTAQQRTAAHSTAQQRTAQQRTDAAAHRRSTARRGAHLCGQVCVPEAGVDGGV